jgi:nucleoside-diphosphate-sugar epimerase
MKLFVTGASGHSGGFFLKRLEKENCDWHLKCVVRETSDLTIIDGTSLDLEKACGDLNDVDFLAREMQGYDMVLHIASIYQSKNVVSAASKAGIKDIVLVHTTGMFSKFKSASADYIEVENEVLAHRDDMNMTVLRPTMIYVSSKDRNMFKLVDYLYRHKFFPIFGKGENLMQPVHAGDLGDAYYDVITNWETTKNKEYNLSGKYAIEYIELVRTVEDYLERRVINLKIPLWFSLFSAVIYNKISKSAIISVEQVQRMMEDKAFSYEEAARDFGYAPRTFADGIKGEVEEYLSKKG